MLRSVRYITVLLVLALALPVLAKPPKHKRRVKKPKVQLVAIWDIRLLGIDEDTSRRVLYDLRQAFERVEGFKLIKEATVDDDILPGWGKLAKRGPAWEATCAGVYLQAGADILVMAHPGAIEIAKKIIEQMS